MAGAEVVVMLCVVMVMAVNVTETPEVLEICVDRVTVVLEMTMVSKVEVVALMANDVVVRLLRVDPDVDDSDPE